ncbi:MAG: gephyrin-like molybdotransferase Glp [Bryobacteraceae bacterium]
MAAFSFPDAQACVVERVRSFAAGIRPEKVPLAEAAGRVLAEDLAADRDYPPVARSTRDGFAVRAAFVPGELRVIGEVRAGEMGGLTVGPGEAIEIMTGASIPEGADAVVMVEHTTREGERLRIGRTAEPGQFINPQGTEAREGATVLRAGKRLDYSDIALAATIGRARLPVFSKPTVAIIATGDEIVEIEDTPASFQVRNSNAQSLAAQVTRAGGLPRLLPIAQDVYEQTRALVERGLEADLLLLSGGVSAGKYDLVERVLAGLGAEFYFDRVLIQPGQPLVFGRVRERFFFGLPGNPASTMVTFELFARTAIRLLGGEREAPLPLAFARLSTGFRHKTGLTRFLPACLNPEGSLTPIAWQGSSDVPALSRANAYFVVDADREEWKAGDLVRVLAK